MVGGEECQKTRQNCVKLANFVNLIRLIYEIKHQSRFGGIVNKLLKFGAGETEWILVADLIWGRIP